MPNYASHFTLNQRTSDHSTYWTLNETAPDWLVDAVRDAHEDELPNDWRYEICHSIVCAIDEEIGGEDVSELVDSLVDIYSSDLLRWLSENLHRIADADEALSNGTAETIPQAIQWAQAEVISRMAYILSEAANENEEADR